MAVTHATRRAAERAADDAIAAVKAAYREHLERIAGAVTPRLSWAELSIGLELDPPGHRGTSAVSRFVSDAPRHRRARPDAAARALIDRLIAGDAVLGVLAGSEVREVVVCEPDEVARLGPGWHVADVAGRGAGPAAAGARVDADAEELDWSGGGAPPRGVAAAPTPPREPPTPTPRAAPTPRTAPPPAARGLPPALAAPGPAARRAAISAPRAFPDGRGVSSLGLGLMRLSTTGRPAEADALAIIHAALDGGVRLLDTADVYGEDERDLHHGERLARRALASWRGPAADVIVATKVGLARPGGRWIPSGRPERLLRAARASRDALGVDAIDLLQLHAPDPRVPWDEQLDALKGLLDAGVARRVGLSNVTEEGLAAALPRLPLAAVQLALSPRHRGDAARAVLARAEAAGLLVLAHSPLGGHRDVAKLAALPALAAVAARRGATPYEAALAWLLALSPRVVPLPGATRVASVTASLHAWARAEALLTDADLAELDRALPWRSPAAPRARGAAAAREAAPAAAWDGVSVPDGVTTVPLAEALAPRDEVLLIMGLPASGKTSLALPFVERGGYARLNRDLRGGRLDDLLAPLAELLAGGARRVVLDNTYGARGARAGVVAAARAAGVPARVLWLHATAADVQINAALRLIRRHGRLLGPEELAGSGRDPNTFGPSVLSRHLQVFEPPSPEEGFTRVDRVVFERRDDPTFTQKALLLDLDGTVRQTLGPRPFPVAPEEVALLPRRREVLARWVADGYRLFGVTNQAGVALGQLDLEAVAACNDRTAELLGLPIEIVSCPHPARPVGCWCRKPLPGLGVLLIERHRLSRRDLVMVGDRASDAEFASALGARYVDAEEFFG